MEDTVIHEETKPAHEILMDIEKGETERFPWELRKRYRSAISDKIKNDFPQFKFATRKVETKYTSSDGTVYIKRELEVERIR